MWFGYLPAGAAGAVDGVAVGLFAGHAYINNLRQVDKNAAVAAEEVIAAYRKQQAEDSAESEIERLGFTLAEEVSGQEQPW